MKKKRVTMPIWIWQLSPKILNYQCKHLLSYIWWYGNNGCNKWNWYLAKRERCSDRTLRRRLNKLHVLHLIAITNPHYKRRRLYRLPYFTHVVWQTQRTAYLDLTGRTQLAYIYDLKEGDCYKTNNHPLCKKKGTPTGSWTGQKRYAGRQPAFISGASPPNPQSVQQIQTDKRHKLKREILIDKLITAGQTMIKAKLLSLEKYPLLESEKCL